MINMAPNYFNSSVRVQNDPVTGVDNQFKGMLEGALAPQQFAKQGTPWNRPNNNYLSQRVNSLNAMAKPGMSYGYQPALVDYLTQAQGARGQNVLQGLGSMNNRNTSMDQMDFSAISQLLPFFTSMLA